MSEGSFFVSGTRKVRFSPATERSLTLRPFCSAIVFDNAMHRPTIVVRETERKLFIDRYCIVHTYTYYIVVVRMYVPQLAQS